MASRGDLAELDSRSIAGSGDSLTLGLAAQVRKPPKRRRRLWGLCAQPRRQHCRRFAAKHKCFLALFVNRAAPNQFRFFGEEKGAAMKFATVTKSLVVGLALTLASSAFAASKANLTLNNPTSINGTSLKAGEYKLQWDGTGPNVEVSIMQGKKVVAKVPAKVVDLNQSSASNAALLKQNSDGTTTLAGVRFQGKKYALELGEGSDGMQAGSSK